MPVTEADERTPLLTSRTNHGHGSLASEGDADAEPPLEVYSQRLVEALRRNDNGPISLDLPDPRAEIVVLLCARQNLATRTYDSGTHLARRVAEDEETRGLIWRLDIEIGSRLDDVSHGDADLTHVLWLRWEVSDGHWASALDLLSTENELSETLSHVLVHRYLETMWTGGPPCYAEDRGPGFLIRLERLMTPRRLHLLHFIASSVFWALTITIALYPCYLSQPSQEDRPVGSWSSTAEVCWLVLAVGHIAQALQRDAVSNFRLLALLPSIMAVLAWPFNTASAYSFVLLSIPFLTVDLISPSPPSIAFLHLPLLPTSTRLFRSLFRLVKGWTLIWPLAILVFVIFSISMNGDINRGFFTLMGTRTTEDVPMEPGVAPFEARVAIAVTFVVLAIMGLAVAFSAKPSEIVSDPPRGRLAHPWEGEYGPSTARIARQHWVSGTRWILGDTGCHHSTSPVDHSLEDEEDARDGLRSRTLCPNPIGPAIPPPLNLIVIPLNVACQALTLCSRVYPTSDRIRNWRRTTCRVRYTASVLVLTPLCWPLAVIGRYWPGQTP